MISNMHKYNFNQSVKVKLTRTGKEIYRKNYAKFGIDSYAYVDKDGFSEFQLWSFMGIFGESIEKGVQVLEDGCIYMYDNYLEKV